MLVSRSPEQVSRRLQTARAQAGPGTVVGGPVRGAGARKFDGSGSEAGGGRLGQCYVQRPDDERRAVREEVSGRMAEFESGGRLVLRAGARIGAERKDSA